jgi:hypothetical protein
MTMGRRNTPADFWLRVDSSSADGCWEWTGRRVDEYGQFDIFGSSWKAHRFAWMLTNGDPGDLCVCHSCDNPPCCNPAHLFLGTKQDNAMDMVDKGRHAMSKRTHCKNGHDFAIHGRERPGYGRRCWACQIEGQRRRRKLIGV